MNAVAKFVGLLAQWMRRDFRVRYVQTLLGSVWALFVPLSLTAAFIFLFDGVAKLDVGVPYAVFAYTGMLIWMVFGTAVTAATLATANTMYIASKASYPRIVAPVSATLLTLVDFSLGLVLLPIFFLLGNVPVRLAPLPFFGSLLGVLVLTIGLGTFLSAFAVFIRDVRNAMPFLVQILLLVTPVAYNAEHVPRFFRPLVTWNPVATYVEGFRSALLGLPGPTAAEWTIALSISGVVASFGIWYFQRVQGRFPDVA